MTKGYDSPTKKASVLSSRAKRVNELPFDKVFVIYGKSGTGKTTLASTFPKSEEAPLYILDILENGVGSISLEDRENIIVVPIETFEDVNEVLTDFERGYTVSSTGKNIPVKCSTIVIDSATQLEYLMKNYLMEADKKDRMNLNLWGQVKSTHDMLWNAAKYLSKKLDCYIVVIAHEKDDKDEDNPTFNKVVPSLAKSGTESLTAKASFIWYTAVEAVDRVGADGKVERENKFMTYIGPASYLVTKCRKPKEVSIPQKVRDLTYDRFYRNVIVKIEAAVKSKTPSYEETPSTKTPDTVDIMDVSSRIDEDLAKLRRPTDEVSTGSSYVIPTLTSDKVNL